MPHLWLLHFLKFLFKMFSSLALFFVSLSCPLTPPSHFLSLKAFPFLFFSFVYQINSSLLTLQTYCDDVNWCNDYHSHGGSEWQDPNTNSAAHRHTVLLFFCNSLYLFPLQILSNRKGLLPEPNLAQLLTSMTNPAALQILMRPYQAGKRGGVTSLSAILWLLDRKYSNWVFS